MRKIFPLLGFFLFLPLLSRAQDAIAVTCWEDAYQGDAQYKLVIDTVTVIAAETCTAKSTTPGVAPPVLQTNTFTGNWGGIGAAHSITVTFLNDAYGGSGATDRNLNIPAVTFDGHTIQTPSCAGSYSAPIGTTGCHLPTSQAVGTWNFVALILPTIGSINPNNAPISAAVNIAGSGFGTTQGTSYVTFNTTNATSFPTWSNTLISVLVPTNATSGNVTVTVNGQKSNGVAFTVAAGPNPNPPAVTAIQVSITASLSCGTTQPPPAQHSVVLSWTASPSSGVTAYNVYRSGTSGSGYIKIGSTTTVLNYTDSTVVGTSTYYYVVTALAGAQESVFSNQASATIP
jgi:hypothetical protein